MSFTCIFLFMYQNIEQNWKYQIKKNKGYPLAPGTFTNMYIYIHVHVYTCSINCFDVRVVSTVPMCFSCMKNYDNINIVCALKGFLIAWRSLSVSTVCCRLCSFLYMCWLCPCNYHCGLLFYSSVAPYLPVKLIKQNFNGEDRYKMFYFFIRERKYYAEVSDAVS